MDKIFSNQAIEKRRFRTQHLLNQVMDSETAILIFSGFPLQKPGGLDQQYYFLPLPEYYWLTGTRRSGGCLVYSRGDGWMHFEKGVSTDEKVWEGANFFCNELDVKDLSDWLFRKKFKKMHLISAADQKEKFSQYLKSEGSPGFELTSSITKEGIQNEEIRKVQEALDQARRPKDEEEIGLIKSCAAAAKAGYDFLHKIIRPGVSERKIQIEYEYQTFKAGSHKVPYETIVGAGDRAAILHAVPTDRLVKSGELVLIDAGADIHDYCVDVTRIFYADGAPSTQQKEIYEIVEKAQRAAIEIAKPGVEWHDCHRKAAQIIGQGLIDLGILRGSLDDLLNRGAIGLFFPHGLGHMVGQRVRDVGGASPGRIGRKVYGTGVRVDLPLEENFLMTFEPGLYFVEALIMRDDTKEKFKDCIQYNQLDSWIQMGGVRIEDDVLIRSAGNLNLTAEIK